MAWDYGMRDMGAQDGWRPRVYKTHFWRPHCPKARRLAWVAPAAPQRQPAQQPSARSVQPTCCVPPLPVLLPAGRRQVHLHYTRPAGGWALLLLLPPGMAQRPGPPNFMLFSQRSGLQPSLARWLSCLVGPPHRAPRRAPPCRAGCLTRATSPCATSSCTFGCAAAPRPPPW
jgi:hypothetical protein